ncbi:MAG: choice-of-anchor Q domain-containing protein, partial [Planctomycetota bacterium]
MITKRNLRMWKMVFVLVVGIGCTTAGGAVRYVNDDASGTGTGLNWGDAYNHLQDALADACSNPDVNQIWVAEGTYKPDQNSAEPNGTGDRTATFQLINGVAIYGGFIGYETSPGERFWPLAETILSGDLDSNDMDVGEPCDLLNEPTRAENSYHVVTGSDTEPNAILDGFIIRAGNANEPSGPNAYGGGMYNDYGSPTVANCTFRENSSGMYGGGMHNEVGNPAVVNCTFSENSAGQHGGGMYNTSPRPTVTNCIFNRNWAAAFGGGFCNVLGHPDLANCTFSGNMAASGGGMYNLSSEPNMVNCTFSRNFATITGGVESDSGSDPTMINCVLWGNRDGTGSGEMAQIGGPASATIAYCCIQGYGQGGVGNINEPPQFVDANGPDGEAGTEDDNLRLGPNSPCIDEGNDLELPGDVTTDLDGRARIADGDCNFVNGISVDMGAYEFAWVYIGDFDMECDVDLADWALFAMAWLKEEGEAGYISDYDISIPADDKIDWRDVKIFCDNWLAGSVTNIDDDLAGYTVSAISGDTTETGGTATFTVVLNSEPTDNVTVNFDTSDLTEGTVS